MSKEEKKLHIILTNRNTVDYLKLAVKSIRENAFYDDHKLTIYDDNSSDGSRGWIKENSKEYNYDYTIKAGKNPYDRTGITKLYNEAVEDSKEDIIFIGHSDMYYGKDWDKHVLKHIEPETIVCSTRIEPNLYGEEKCKIVTDDYGKDIDDFKKKELDKKIEKLKKKNKDKISKGIFAPFAFYKKDWEDVGGIPSEFEPQSHEDSISKDRHIFAEVEGIKDIYTVEELFEKLSSKYPIENHKGKEIIDLSKSDVKTLVPCKNGDITLNRVKNLSRHYTEKNLIKVATSFGITEITEDHSLIDKNLNGKKLKDLDINSIWCPSGVLRETGLRRNLISKYILPIKNLDFVQKEKGKLQFISKNRWGKTIKPSVEIPKIEYEFDEYGKYPESKNLCRFLGYYLSEGNITGNYIHFSNKRNEILEDYTNCLKVVGNFDSITTTENKKKGYESVYVKQKGSKILSTALKKIAGSNCRDKKIPSFIYNIPKYYQKQFLYSFIRGDGNISFISCPECNGQQTTTLPEETLFSKEIIKNTNIRISCKSRQLCDGLIYLIKRIFPKINISVRYRENKNGYAIRAFFGKPENKKLEIIEREKVTDYVYDIETYRKHTFLDMNGLFGLHNSALFYTWKLAGKEFVQAWDSLVFHFSGKGSRHKDGDEDSEEWEKSNRKNFKNFVRMFGQPPLYSNNMQDTEDKSPVPLETIPECSLIILVGPEVEVGDIEKKLEEYECYFDEVILQFDEFEGNKIAAQEAKDYITEESKKTDLVKKGKLQILERDLDKDFAKQRNNAVKNARCDWVFHFDLDEDMPSIGMIKRIIYRLEKEGKLAAAFPRRNFLDGEPQNKLEEKPDFQCRLHKKNVEWVRPVHEMPVPFYNALTGDKVAGSTVKLVPTMELIHMKSSKRQKEQNKFYDEIAKENHKPKTKVLFDSVLFTHEGITKHGREEAIQLNKKGYQLFLTDLYKSGHGEEFKEMYEAFDVTNTDYITYVNQPPLRQTNKNCLQARLKYPNLVYFLAYEGTEMPPDWVKVMKHPHVKQILTPSNYCKEIFEEHGLDNVKVLNHGVKPRVFKPNGASLELESERVEGKFVFLFVGTYHGESNKDRKGLDIFLKAYKKVRKKFGEDVAAILKLNPIYYNQNDWRSKISKLCPDNADICIIDSDLSEKDMAGLYRLADCYVAPSRGEGFGMTAMEALACGTPVVATDATGFKEFLNKDNAYLIKTLRETKAEERFPYAGDNWHAKWVEPSALDTVKKMEQAYNREKFDEQDMKKISKDIRDNYSWKQIGDQMDEIFKEL